MLQKLLQQTLTANSVLIELIDKIIFCIHMQNYDKALHTSAELISCLTAGLGQLQDVVGIERTEELNRILEGIFAAQNNKDYILQADLYELQLRRYFIEIQEDIISSEGFAYDDTTFEKNRDLIRQTDSELYELLYQGTSPFDLGEMGYEVEFSSCGLMTAALTDAAGRYYLHSNNRVSQEAFTLAASWYDEEVVQYIVYGFGLGYHIKELLQLDGNIHIEVYEADLNVLKLAAAYTELGLFMKHPMVRIIYDPKHTKMLGRLKELKEDERFIIHYPSLRNVRIGNIKQKLENYFIQYSSLKNQIKLLNGNFRENIMHYNGFAEELREHFQNKDLYIIAAGPSLDKNFRLLKEVNRSEGIILATGTVYRKLLTAGISPDYFIVTDANERVYAQIAGLEESKIPMLYLSTAYKGFALHYQGKKYIIFQKDYSKAEDYANKHNIMLNRGGGSVSTVALDVGISFGCRRIIFLGLDLAYTGNFCHASETSLRSSKPSPDQRIVTDINGDAVYTGITLDMYRHWIEERICGEEGIEFIDATEGGARVAGMRIMTLREVLGI